MAVISMPSLRLSVGRAGVTAGVSIPARAASTPHAGGARCLIDLADTNHSQAAIAATSRRTLEQS